MSRQNLKEIKFTAWAKDQFAIFSYFFVFFANFLILAAALRSPAKEN